MHAKKAKSEGDISNTDHLASDAHAVLDLFSGARNLSTPVWVYDVDNCRVVYANAQACKMWQAESEEDLCSRDMSKGMSSTVAKRLKQYQADFIERQTTFREMWTLYPNGEPVSSSVAFRGFRLPDGRMAMQCEVLERASDEPDNLRSAEALLHTDVKIALFELDGPALYMNPAARNSIGGPSKSFQQLFVDSKDYHVMMFELDGSGEHRMVARVTTASGKHWFDLSAKLCSDAVTGQPAVLLTAFDVSELKIARDKARYLADRDQLTGCYNRAFMHRLVEDLANASEVRCTLLYFDVDRFKNVNDTFGHEAGDNVLRELALRAQQVIGPEDIVVRLGGDEFAILLYEDADYVHVHQKAKVLFCNLSGPVRIGATSIDVNVSMGIADFTPAQTDFESALRQADIALYHSKREGRNRYTIYTSEMGAAALDRARFKTEIESALKQRDFVLHYQPRIDLRSGNVVSMEGLVRWKHPEKGIIGPDNFIPICEETGLIDSLGQQVLEIGFEQAMKWQDAGEYMHLSLNISPRQFADERLTDMLASFARKPGFPTDRIELEITENVLIGDLDDIASKLKTITDMGYQIAIDDFGTGYSNLSYISRIPLSCIKIDQSFVSQLPKSGPIIRLILSLGKQIGATIVAEGVETQDQYDWLSRHHCDQIQGFFIARPAPLDELGGDTS
ncbi:bifunctional diguanylate cyclase/phosphodiesterase [uncultured Roseobacter sp.]|uniref:putative bifunctional diguanylate cyclase/phosphodiesterase n=1 Tax=uncultured Roseobacter sp. TaxID=114847 RepID=UPI0026141FB7|nr:EAL domain-containing protein [uncultured Roseobacter sp.]